MSAMQIGLAGIGGLLLLMALGMPIGFAMAISGFIGFICLKGFDPALGVLQGVPYATVFSVTLSVIPLFMLMGQFAFYSRLSEDLYDTAYKWLGGLKGGLAIATIAGCAAFSAICGSSSATAATMGYVSLPWMRKYSYEPSMATGVVAAGGTLGILIPPSLGFILYGIVTQESIGKLFLAGILPGIVLSLLFMVGIYIMVSFNPSLGPQGPQITWKDKFKSLKGIWATVFLFVLVMGGIYGGFFTPNEAGAIGAFGAFVIAIARKQMSWKSLSSSLLETGKTSVMILFIIVGAMIFSTFLTASTIPVKLAAYFSGSGLPPWTILAMVLVFYLVLGCFMDIASGLVLTLPIFYPIIMNAGYDSIWFGVIIVIMFELGLITPPVGLNVFVIKGVAKDVPMEVIFKGVMPFVGIIIAFIVILTIFPQIATIVPVLAR
jgi:C4-dicarboxylate transporter, DctM subunit